MIAYTIQKIKGGAYTWKTGFYSLLPFWILLLAALCMIIIMLRRKSSLNERLLKKKLNAAIETINRRTQFFSDMVHEMKTPLSVIVGAVQLLEMKAKEKNLVIIKSNCCRLLRLTNNLLDLARTEAGYHALKPVNCKLDSLLEEIVLSVKPYALQATGIELYRFFRGNYDGARY